MSTNRQASMSRLSGTHKAAMLLVLLGEEVAAAIYKNLPERDLQKITQEIAELGTVSADHASDVLEEYAQLSLTQEYLARGGREYATKLLIKAFGEDGARKLLEQVSRLQEMGASKLDSLQKADPQQLSKFLEGEHPQTIALVLAHLDTGQGSELLKKLPDQTRAEAVKRLAQLRQFSPEIAQKLSISLHNRLQALGEQSRRTYAGLKGVADLLNRLDPGTSKGILQSIEQDDPKLALGVRNLMFTFEDLLSVPESSLRELVTQLDKKIVAVALKGASEELKMRVFKCMSSRAVEMLKEDMDALGLVRSRDVTKAQQEAVTHARQLESEGKIVLRMEGEDEYIA